MLQFEEQLKKLKEPSVIVMDNASYHSRSSHKAPNSSSTKEEILSFLKTIQQLKEGIDWATTMPKTQLLEITRSVVRRHSMRYYANNTNDDNW